MKRNPHWNRVSIYDLTAGRVKLAPDDGVLFVESDKALVSDFLNKGDCPDPARCIYWSDDIHHNDDMFDMDMVRVSAYGYLVQGCFSLPHFAQSCFFKFTESPKPRVIVSGARHEPRGLRTEALKHAAVDELAHGQYFQESYANVVSGYLAALVVTHNASRRYLVAKFFEVAATGSLLLADDRVRGELEVLGFRDRVHCLFCNAKNVRVKIDYVLDPQNRSVVDAIRRLGQSLVRKNHSLVNRLDELDLIVDYVLLTRPTTVDARRTLWPH